MPKFFVVRTFNGVHAVEGVLYDDGVVAVRLTFGEGKYADRKGPLVFEAGMAPLEAIARVVGSTVEFVPTGV